MSSRAHGRHLVAALLTLAALPAAAQIGPLTNQSLFFDQAANARRGDYLEADGGLAYTDNVSRDPSGSGDTLVLLGLVGDLARQGTRLDYRLASNLALVKYLHSEYQTQPFGYLDGTGDLWIVPGVLAWIGRETYTQTVIVPSAPVTPDNLESLNYATTGPRFTLRPTLRTTITVDGTYSYINSSSKSPLYVDLDNHRYAGGATLTRAFSNTSSAYLTGSAQKVEFKDQTDNTNFKEEQGLAGYKLGDARTVLEVSAGYAKVRLLGLVTVQTLRGPRQIPQSETPSGTLWRFGLSRQTSPNSRLSLHALQQVTDASNLFRMNLDEAVAGSVANRLTTGQPFTDREFGGDWRIQASRTSLELGFLDISERYRLNPSSDRDVKDASVFVVRQLRPELTWHIGAELEHQTFKAGGSSNIVNAITSVRWQLSRELGLRFLYAHSTLTPYGYRENQIGVTASYAFLEGGPGSGHPSTQSPSAPAPGTPTGSPPGPRPL
jgi:hypothetical protein